MVCFFWMGLEVEVGLGREEERAREMQVREEGRKEGRKYACMHVCMYVCINWVSMGPRARGERA